jgi:hypothetical protein
MDPSLNLNPPLGSHLVSPRHGYHHHGIYVGNGKVVHYAGLSRALGRGPVEEIQLSRFAAGGEVWIVAEPDALYATEGAARRALSRLGENRYRLLSNNCEHFCMWCLYGESRSPQVSACLSNPWTGLRTVMGLLGAWLMPKASPAAA